MTFAECRNSHQNKQIIQSNKQPGIVHPCSSYQSPTTFVTGKKIQKKYINIIIKLFNVLCVLLFKKKYIKNKFCIFCRFISIKIQISKDLKKRKGKVLV